MALLFLAVVDPDKNFLLLLELFFKLPRNPGNFAGSIIIIIIRTSICRSLNLDGFLRFPFLFLPVRADVSLGEWEKLAQLDGASGSGTHTDGVLFNVLGRHNCAKA